MFRRPIATSALIAALSATSVTQALADADALVGGVIGGVVGGLIVNEANKNKQRQTQTVRQAPVYSATRAANREVQTSLNYFGFNAGVVDGVIGRGTRAAVANYQAHLGYPATGQLTPYERDFLVSSYHRAVAGGAVTAQQIATNALGTKGLLKTYQAEALGVQAPGTMAAAPQQVQPAPGQGWATAAAPAPAAGLPTFMAAPAPGESLAAHCNRVSLHTSTNGFVTAASMTDPRLALSEQFCLARTYTLEEGQQMAARVPGVTQDQIVAQCGGFGTMLAAEVTAAGSQPMALVVDGARRVVMGTGLAPDQLSGTAKICLSSGYRTDDMGVALGSALVLVALGETAYGEIVGHHLAQGFGAAERPDLALAWYDAAIAAVEGGQRRIVAPGQPERSALLQQAAYAVAGQPSPVTTKAALPSFNVQ